MPAASRAHKRRLLWITDIPTPYRIHLLVEVDRIMVEQGMELDVLFMSQSSPVRRWKFASSDMPFRNRIVPGLHFQIGWLVGHLNPGIVWNVLRHPPDWLVVGGAWWIPTSVASTFAGMRSSRCKVILHLEANRYAMRYDAGLVGALRRGILAWADAFLVPGQIAVETLQDICKDSPRPFLPLPNLVDEKQFRGRVEELRAGRAELRAKWNLGSNDLVMLWPARLDESIKGILRFLKIVEDLVPENMRILLAGEGADRARIEAWVSEHLPHNVRLIGYQPEPSMLELLAAADVLLLPSVIDPNPLSVIEGLWAGLPLFISNRCGNSPEALEPNRNGWVVDPNQPESVRESFLQLAKSSEEDRMKMGAVSRLLAEERFSTVRCVRTFVEALKTL